MAKKKYYLETKQKNPSTNKIEWKSKEIYLEQKNKDMFDTFNENSYIHTNKKNLINSYISVDSNKKISKNITDVTNKQNKVYSDWTDSKISVGQYKERRKKLQDEMYVKVISKI